AHRWPHGAAGAIDFQRDVQPILVRACVACHGNLKHKGGLRLDSGPAALKGGNSGTVIKPGDSAQSRLVHLVAGLDPDLQMPPDGPRLSAAEVGRLRAWIDQGAKWPRDVVLTAGAPAKGATHWAYRPVQRPAAPKVANTAWVRNPIDAFVLGRLEAERMAPSPEADRGTL